MMELVVFVLLQVLSLFRKCLFANMKKGKKRGSYNGKNSEVDLIAATWIGLMHRPLSLRAVCETSQNNLYRFRLAAYFLTTFVSDFGSEVHSWEAK